MAKDTLLQSQQQVAPFQLQTNEQRERLSETMAASQAEGLRAYFAAVEANERSRANAVAVAVEQAKLQDYQNRLANYNAELQTRMLRAQVMMTEEQVRQVQAATKKAEEPDYSKLYGQVFESGGRSWRLMPKAGGGVETHYLSDEQARLHRRSQEAAVAKIEAEIDLDKALAERHLRMPAGGRDYPLPADIDRKMDDLRESDEEQGVRPRTIPDYEEKLQRRALDALEREGFRVRGSASTSQPTKRRSVWEELGEELGMTPEQVKFEYEKSQGKR